MFFNTSPESGGSANPRTVMNEIKIQGKSRLNIK